MSRIPEVEGVFLISCIGRGGVFYQMNHLKFNKIVYCILIFTTHCSWQIIRAQKEQKTCGWICTTYIVILETLYTVSDLHSQWQIFIANITYVGHMQNLKVVQVWQTSQVDVLAT